MNTIRVKIAFADVPSTADSVALNELQESLGDSSIIAQSTIDKNRTGVKDGGLMVGLTIAGLGLSALSTLISAIALWGSKRNYSIGFKSGETTFAANNLSPKETLTIAQALKDKATASDIEVLISHR